MRKWKANAKMLKKAGKIMLFVVTVGVIVAAHATVKARWAKRQVEAFCGSVVIGQPVAEVENAARRMHLKYRTTGSAGGKDGTVVVWEEFAFDRWFCDIEYKDGKATAKKVTFLD